MKYFHILIVLLMLFIYGCTGSPLQISAEAEKKTLNLNDVQNGMSKNRVRELMGNPYKIEKTTFENIDYDVWYYITREVLIYQDRINDSNLTPLIFYHDKLIGTGWSFYNHVFDRNKKAKQESANPVQNGLPSNEHKIYSPYENSPEEKVINKLVEEKKIDTIPGSPSQTSPNQPAQGTLSNTPTQGSGETITNQPQQPSSNIQEHKEMENILKDFIDKEAQKQTPSSSTTPPSTNPAPSTQNNAPTSK